MSVARFDWTDETTFGYYADGFLRDLACLDEGEPTQRFDVRGGIANVFPGKGSDVSNLVDPQLIITLDGSIVSVDCDWRNVAPCRTFASELMQALDVR